ncbi:hypothetical protein JXM83_05650 [Candidatus Woesearchaeota archaeon]|nr:hypothetical protein [Candidatus Woesearchaeota archaeon]
MTTFINVNPDIIEKLSHFGFSKIATKSPHELARLDGPCFAILFHSKKLLLQGKKEIVDDISKTIESLGYQKDIKIIIHPEEIKKTTTNKIEIGSDETLKGDTFGGLVVAAVSIDERARRLLSNINIQDSKKLTDSQIMAVAQQIRNLLSKDEISVRILSPLDYNSLTEQGLNVTQILNRLHEYVHKELEAKSQNKKTIHITDKYPGCTVGKIIEEKSESKYLSVAAASIIARNAGLLQLQAIADELHIPLPKGSTHIKDYLELLKQKNLEIKKYVKTDFGNVKEFFN